MAYLQYRPTQTLYQYTSVDGLFGILASKHLRFSDLRAANDPREINLGVEKVFQALKALVPSLPPGREQEFLSELIGRLDAYFRRVEVFCSCFSMAEDKLPMWSAYGQSYGGLALGFRPSALLPIPARVQKVTYLDVATEAQEIGRIAAGIADQAARHARTNNIEPLITAGSDAIAAVTALKHQDWAYEREVRMIYVQPTVPPTGAFARMLETALPKTQKSLWQAPMQRTAGTRIINYVEFPFGRFRDGSIDASRAFHTILIGPHCPLSVADVERELSKQGYVDCSVRKSDCLIRK